MATRTSTRMPCRYHNGFGIGAIPAIGYRLTLCDAVQIGLLGTAGLIFT